MSDTRWYNLVKDYILAGAHPTEVKLILQEKYNLDIKYETIRRHYSRIGVSYGKGNAKLEFVDRKPEPTVQTVDEFFDLMVQFQKKVQDMDTKQTTMTVKIKENKPVGIIKWGDWHLGSDGTDYIQFKEDKELIQNTEGIYLIGMGDYKDNASAYLHKNEKESITRQSMQDELVVRVFEETVDKWIAIIRGCHEDWDYKLVDKDFVSYLCELTGSVNLWHGGEINIELANHLYKFRCRHKYQGESGLNTTNAQRRLLDAFGVCDEIDLAHKHFPDLQMLDRQGQKVIYCRSGSYKKFDAFGQKIGGYSGIVSVPVTVIFPDTHKLIPFSDLRDGLRFLKAVRNEY